LDTNVKILAMSGSLQATSSNATLLRVAQSVAPQGVGVVIYDGLEAIPPFNPDHDGNPGPPAVADLRAQVASADGVLIASPEYAYGVPGALKNALDWLVGSGELYGKPVAVLIGSPRPDGGRYAREALQWTLGAQGARLVTAATVQMVRNRQSEGEARAVQAVTEALAALVRGATARPGRLLPATPAPFPP
jgi:NAD(P)H-dependent FMN reductase